METSRSAASVCCRGSGFSHRQNNRVVAGGARSVGRRSLWCRPCFRWLAGALRCLDGVIGRAALVGSPLTPVLSGARVARVARRDRWPPGRCVRRDSPLGPSTMLLDRVALGEQHGSGSYFCMKNLVRHSSEAWSCGAEDLSRAAMRSRASGRKDTSKSQSWASLVHLAGSTDARKHISTR